MPLVYIKPAVIILTLRYNVIVVLRFTIVLRSMPLVLIIIVCLNDIDCYKREIQRSPFPAKVCLHIGLFSGLLMRLDRYELGENEIESPRLIIMGLNI